MQGRRLALDTKFQSINQLQSRGELFLSMLNPCYEKGFLISISAVSSMSETYSAKRVLCHGFMATFPLKVSPAWKEFI
jgi:hypothetical protein